MSSAVLGDVWIVIAAYNEGERIGNTLRELHASGYHNVVVVDDGSRDDTGQHALAAGAWTLRHAINLGQGAALQTGIRFALLRGAGFIVTFDADGQHRADEISRLLQPVQSGEADVALGSRFLGKAENIPWTRKLILKGGVLFTRIVSRVKVTDAHNGFRALSRGAAEKIRLRQNRMAHASEILDEIREHGLRYVEVPVTIRYTEETLAKGQSSWNALRIVGQFLMGRLVR
jgi:glycosyltransferase involved in cell wall biosynthesis